MKVAIAAAIAVTVPFAASAEGFTTEDLGSTQTEAECVDRARLVFREFDRASSIGEIVAGNWTVSAFDVISNDYDAHIACAYGPNDTTRGTLVVYSGDNSDDGIRQDIAARMKTMWEAWE